MGWVILRELKETKDSSRLSAGREQGQLDFWVSC